MTNKLISDDEARKREKVLLSQEPDRSDNKSTGKALRLLRVYHDLKTCELAKQIDISQGYLSEMERGNKIPSLESIEKYANFFNINPSAILLFSEKLETDTIKGRAITNIRNNIIAFLEVIAENKE